MTPDRAFGDHTPAGGDTPAGFVLPGVYIARWVNGQTAGLSIRRRGFDSPTGDWNPERERRGGEDTRLRC